MNHTKHINGLYRHMRNALDKLEEYAERMPTKSQNSLVLFLTLRLQVEFAQVKYCMLSTAIEWDGGLGRCTQITDSCEKIEDDLHNFAPHLQTGNWDVAGFIPLWQNILTLTGAIIYEARECVQYYIKLSKKPIRSKSARS